MSATSLSDTNAPLLGARCRAQEWRNSNESLRCDICGRRWAANARTTTRTSALAGTNLLIYWPAHSCNYSKQMRPLAVLPNYTYGICLAHLASARAYLVVARSISLTTTRALSSSPVVLTSANYRPHKSLANSPEAVGASAAADAKANANAIVAAAADATSSAADTMATSGGRGPPARRSQVGARPGQ